jgi:histone H3/H4
MRAESIDLPSPPHVRMNGGHGHARVTVRVTASPYALGSLSKPGSDSLASIRSTFHRFFLLPNIKIRHQDGTPWEPGREMLRRVIRRRVAETLLDPEAMEALVEASGGLLRELIRLACSSVICARRRRDARILPEDVAGAMRETQNTFDRILNREDYQHLRKVQEQKSLGDLPKDAANRLLHNLSVLEYDGEIWWDVHPAVRELLKEKENERSE